MKRLVIILSVLSMVFGLTAFECSSSELNSAKMYMADNVKNWAKAKEMLNLELKKNPQSDEALYLLGKIDGIQAKYNDMVANYSKSLAISSKFKKEIEFDKGHYWGLAFNKGIAFYNRAQRVKADSATVVFGRALSAFEEAMAILPDTLVAHENYVYTALNMGKIELIEAPLKTLTAKGKKADYFTLLGKLYLDKGNKAKEAGSSADAEKYYNEALSLLNGAKTRFASDPGFMETLTNAYIFAGKIDEAKASFAEGVKSQPNNKSFRYNYGTILLNLKDYPAAEEQLKKAVELDPNYLDAIYNLAACYVNWGVDMNEKAVAANQATTEHKDKIKLALPLLNKYVEKKTDDAAVWETLGKAHSALGNSKEAEEAFKKADQYRK